MKKVCVILFAMVFVITAAAAFSVPPVYGPGGGGPPSGGPGVPPGGPGGPGGPPRTGPGGPGMGGGQPMFAPQGGLTMALMPPTPQYFMRNDKLQLTEDQKTKLRTAMMNADKTRQPLIDKLKMATDAIRPAILADTYNPKTIQDLTAKAEKAEQDLFAANIDVWTQIRGILTPEQMKIARENLMFPLGRPFDPGNGGMLPPTGSTLGGNIGPGPGPGPKPPGGPPPGGNQPPPPGNQPPPPGPPNG
jgi:Spy/CpxP family protein refolding chaperone